MYLDKIPKIRPGVIDGLYADANRKFNIKESTPDLQFIEYLIKHNPELAKNMQSFIKLIGACPKHITKDTAYKLMMGCVITSLRAVNIELELQDMERN